MGFGEMGHNPQDSCSVLLLRVLFTNCCSSSPAAEAGNATLPVELAVFLVACRSCDVCTEGSTIDDDDVAEMWPRALVRFTLQSKTCTIRRIDSSLSHTSSISPPALSLTAASHWQLSIALATTVAGDVTQLLVKLSDEISWWSVAERTATMLTLVVFTFNKSTTSSCFSELTSIPPTCKHSNKQQSSTSASLLPTQPHRNHSLHSYTWSSVVCLCVPTVTDGVAWSVCLCVPIITDGAAWSVCLCVPIITDGAAWSVCLCVPIVTDGVAWSVCLSVCVSLKVMSWVLQKWLNWSICQLEGRLRWAKKTM